MLPDQTTLEDGNNKWHECGKKKLFPENLLEKKFSKITQRHGIKNAPAVQNKIVSTV